MADGVLGLGVEIPTVSIGGLMANSWIYVFIIGIIGLILILGLALVLFYITYSRKIELYENTAGRGYVRTLITRARSIKVQGGSEVLKTLIGGHYVTAYGRKVAKNTYVFCKGEDGYWYNSVFGDFDTKMGMLDIEPVDKNVRMFHTATLKLARDEYGKGNTFEKVMAVIVIFILMVGMIGGFWLMAGKINEGLVATETASKINQETIKLANSVLQKIDNIQSGGSGLTQVEENEGG